MYVPCMMKLRRIGIVAVILPLVLVLSSCIRMRQEINVNNQEKIEVKADYGVLKEKSQSGGVKDSDAVCQRGMSSVKLPGDFKQEGYQDDKYIGCKLSGTAKLSDISYLSFDESSKQWSFHMPGSNSQGISASMITDFEIKVTFPGKVLTASGTGEISGNTVTWKDPADLTSSEGLKATASNTSDLTWLWVVLGVMVVGGAVVAVILVQRGRAKAARPGPGQPGPQGGFQGPGNFHQPSGQFPPALRATGIPGPGWSAGSAGVSGAAGSEPLAVRYRGEGSGGVVRPFLCRWRLLGSRP